MADGLDDTEISFLKQIRQLGRWDADQAIGVLMTTPPSAEASSRLADCWKDQFASQFGYPWIQDGLTELERETLGYLLNMQRIFQHRPPRNVHTGFRRFLREPWLSDGITDKERHAICFELRHPWEAGEHPGPRLDRISSLAAPDYDSTGWWDCPRPLPPFGPVSESAVLYFPWQGDGISRYEAEALQYLQVIEREHPDVASALREGFPWLADSSLIDDRILQGVMLLARGDPSLAHQVIGYPWLTDGFTDTSGPDDFIYLSTTAYLIAQDDPSLAERFLSFPWVVDLPQVSWPERTLESVALYELRDMINPKQESPVHPEGTIIQAALPAWEYGTPSVPFVTHTARRILSYPRLADGIDILDYQFLVAMKLIHSVSTDADMDALLDSGLFEIEGHSGGGQTDFVGPLDTILLNWKGVSAGEFLSLSRPLLHNGLTSEEIGKLVMGGQSPSDREFWLYDSETRSKRTSLPLRGEVELVVVSRDPFQEDKVFGWLRRGMEVQEEFMNEPFPTGDLVILILDSRFGGGHAGGQWFGSHMIAKEPDAGVVYHELGHYYFAQPDFGPTRTEGPFARFEGNWTAEGVPDFFKAYLNHLGGVEDLQAAYDRLPGPGPLAIGYSAFQGWWLEMYLTLGHETVQSYIRELYRVAQATPEELTKAEVYRILLSNTSDDKQDEFREIYDAYRVGPPSDS